MLLFHKLKYSFPLFYKQLYSKETNIAKQMNTHKVPLIKDFPLSPKYGAGRFLDKCSLSPERKGRRFLFLRLAYAM